jgi:hypothetical protein
MEKQNSPPRNNWIKIDPKVNIYIYNLLKRKATHTGDMKKKRLIQAISSSY